VKSASAEHVPKVLQVVEEAKRLRHKNGQDDDELYQYVLYDNERQKGPRRINLDDSNNMDKYKPPNSLTVYLTKIPMPELQPKTQVDERKGKGESNHTRKRSSDHGSNNHNTKPNASSSLSVPKPSLLTRRKRSSPSLTPTNQSPNYSPPKSPPKNSEPSSNRQSYSPPSAPPTLPQTQPPPPSPRIYTQPPPERPTSTFFDFLRR